jgi:hypothetical protein
MQIDFRYNNSSAEASERVADVMSCVSYVTGFRLGIVYSLVTVNQ